MIKAEVEGSGLLLLAVDCSAFKVGGAELGVEGVVDLLAAGSWMGPAPLLDFFFFVMFWDQKVGRVRNAVTFLQQYLKFLHSLRDRVCGKTSEPRA